MAAVVYGGSPRHHGRMMVSSGSMNTPPHLPQNSPLQQSTPFMSSNQSNIIIPPASYLSSPSSLQHYQQHHHHHHHPSIYASHRNVKRKSAVEMLAESKAFYVKSEIVLDRQQQLNIRGNSSSSSYLLSPSRTLPHHIGGGGGSSSISQQQQYQHLHQQHHLHQMQQQQQQHHQQQQQQHHQQQQQHHHHQQQQQQQPRPASRRTASASSDLLQTKLRKLLNTSDSKETITPDVLINPKYVSGDPGVGVGVLGTKYDTYNSYLSPKMSQELMIHPETQSDVSVFFPSAFLSPQSLPPHPTSDDDIYSFGIDDSLILTDDYRAISPPAEYAEDNVSEHNGANNRYGYQRSYSHSQAVASNEADYSPSYNINSHKSLPDLHSQISRHSPHSEALSCCSRGNRSNKSGSSFNRDSGGSSGHYTHRSEPANCCKQKDPAVIIGGSDFRRDSGSSTQHSGNSYYAYGIPPLRYDCMECRAKIQKDADCLLNFTTPEVPEAFQDDYNEKTKKYYDERDSGVSGGRKFYSAGGKNHPTSSSGAATMQQQQQQQQQSDDVVPQAEADLSPPLGTFKRQKCLRFKSRGRYSNSSNSNDDRKPILRSKSDISDRYWNRSVPLLDSGNSSSSSSKPIEKRGKSESMSQLERFFDRLGLNEEKYEEYIDPKSTTSSYSDNDSDQSSAVFFSDVSTVDSTRLPDSTETTQTSAPYRPSEPPSIVERNARIIKWLCNCKKMQLT